MLPSPLYNRALWGGIAAILSQIAGGWVTTFLTGVNSSADMFNILYSNNSDCRHYLEPSRRKLPGNLFSGAIFRDPL